MTDLPAGYVGLAEFARRLGLSPFIVRFAILTRAITVMEHEEKLWVLRRQAEIWLAAEPVHPSGFAILEASLGGVPLVPRVLTTGEGEEA